MRSRLTRRSIAGIAASGLLAAIAREVSNPLLDRAPGASAQEAPYPGESSDTGTAPAADGSNATEESLPLAPPPASPVAPSLPPDAPADGVAPVTGSSTTNLGGSDIAVSSAGGSYEVAGPKRRSKRMPTPPARP